MNNVAATLVTVGQPPRACGGNLVWRTRTPLIDLLIRAAPGSQEATNDIDSTTGIHDPGDRACSASWKRSRRYHSGYRLGRSQHKRLDHGDERKYQFAHIQSRRRGRRYDVDHGAI